MSIRLEDPKWQTLEGSIRLHSEGVFLSPIQTNDLSLNAAVSAIMLNDRQTLRNMFFEQEADVEILECNVGTELTHHDGYWCSSFLGKEARPGRPNEYCAFVLIASCGFQSKTIPIVLSLWVPEDQLDSQVRETYIQETMGKECACDPYSRQFDDLFVFHALSKLRYCLDQLPHEIRVLQ